jgi:CheY-like chemotaxis protein
MYQKTALIIDDSPTSQAVLKRLLKDIDFQVDTQKSGEEALQFLQSNIPDVIFLDHIMPGLDGFQVLRQLKSNPTTYDIPVVMYTSQNALKYASEARALGAVGVLPKQLSSRDLSFIMQRVEQSLAAQPRAGSSDIVIDLDVATNADGNNETTLEETQHLTEIELLKQALHSELEMQRKEFLAEQRTVNAELERRLALQAVQISNWQQRSRWRTVVTGLLVVVPVLASIYFAAQMTGQQNEITRLQTALQQQQQDFMHSSNSIAKASTDRAVRDSAEWEDMKFMLETLIATVEAQARAGKPVHARDVMRQAEANADKSVARSNNSATFNNSSEASSQSDVDERESKP